MAASLVEPKPDWFRKKSRFEIAKIFSQPTFSKRRGKQDSSGIIREQHCVTGHLRPLGDIAGVLIRAVGVHNVRAQEVQYRSLVLREIATGTIQGNSQLR